MLQKSILFFSAYSPLLALLAFQVNDSFWWIRLVLIVMVAAGLLGLFFILYLTSRKPKLRMFISSRRDAGAESAGFLASYLLPVFTVAIDSAYVAWATALYLVMAFVVTVRSSLIQVNPVLMILGYRILAVEIAASGSPVTSRTACYFITRQDVRNGDMVFAKRLGGDVYLVESRSGDGEG